MNAPYFVFDSLSHAFAIAFVYHIPSLSKALYIIVRITVCQSFVLTHRCFCIACIFVDLIHVFFCLPIAFSFVVFVKSEYWIFLEVGCCAAALIIHSLYFEIISVMTFLCYIFAQTNNRPLTSRAHVMTQLYFLLSHDYYEVVLACDCSAITTICADSAPMNR